MLDSPTERPAVTGPASLRPLVASMARPRVWMSPRVDQTLADVMLVRPPMLVRSVDAGVAVRDPMRRAACC